MCQSTCAQKTLMDTWKLSGDEACIASPKHYVEQCYRKIGIDDTLPIISSSLQASNF